MAAAEAAVISRSGSEAGLADSRGHAPVLHAIDALWVPPLDLDSGGGNGDEGGNREFHTFEFAQNCLRHAI